MRSLFNLTRSFITTSRGSSFSLKTIKRAASPSPSKSDRLYFQTRHTSTESAAANAVSPVKLRSYQEESIIRVLKRLAEGDRRLGLSLATGSGKTVIFSHLIDRLPSPNEHATQTLILAHRRELVEQAARHCAKLYPSKCVEIEMGSQHASGEADITVASVQSITSGGRLTKYDTARFKLLLVDEAHHIAADTYLRILEHFNLKEKHSKPNTALVGVSATWERADGLGLGIAIDDIVYHKDYIDMIDDNWLSAAVFTTVRSGADLSRVRTSAGDFQTSALSKAVNSDEINEVTVRAWFEKAWGRKSTLGFCVDKAHVKSLTDCFRCHGIDARYVDSDTKKLVREQRLEGFKAGEFPVLLNCGIYTEGTDIPNIDCVLLARPTKSRSLLQQMIGRGLRLHVSKENCHIIDMVSSLKTGIVSTPTLFGLDADEVVDEAGASDLKALKVQKPDGATDLAASSSAVDVSHALKLSGDIHFTDYESVYDLISDRRQEQHIHALSPYAWLRLAETKYRLTGHDGSCLVLLAEGGLWSLYFYPRLLPTTVSKSPWARPIRKAERMPFESAVRAAATLTKQDTYKDKYPQWFIARNAPWRRKPATQKQVDRLNEQLGQSDGSRSDAITLSVDDISKGDAVDYITKLKHGGMGQFKKQVAAKKAVARKEERVEKLGPRVKWST